MAEILPVDVALSDLLNAEQMADFACDGYVRLEGVVPAELNQQVVAEVSRFVDADAGTEATVSGRPRFVSDTHRMYGDRFAYWDNSPTIKTVFRVPRVAGAIRSLMGPTPVYNHSFVHIIPPRHAKSQDWHADSVIDPRSYVFDVLAMYFPEDTPDEMGPTLVLPGSHLRSIRYGSIAHYQNILGQKRLACSAGTVVIAHADLWHCAQPNSSDRPRYMFKIRLEVPSGGDQRGYFDVSGFDGPDLLARIRNADQPWYGAEHREERIERAKFWRYLTNSDGAVDVHHHLVHLGL